jgi:hypothetical protein
MGRMKDFAMQVSEDMGKGGRLTEKVLAEAQRRLDVHVCKNGKVLRIIGKKCKA